MMVVSTFECTAKYNIIHKYVKYGLIKKRILCAYPKWKVFLLNVLLMRPCEQEKLKTIS